MFWANRVDINRTRHLSRAVHQILPPESVLCEMRLRSRQKHIFRTISFCVKSRNRKRHLEAHKYSCFQQHREGRRRRRDASECCEAAWEEKSDWNKSSHEFKELFFLQRLHYSFYTLWFFLFCNVGGSLEIMSMIVGCWLGFISWKIVTK